MAYTPVYDPGGWEDDPSTDTPISASALNYIEAGIEAAAAVADAAIPQAISGVATDKVPVYNGSAWVAQKLVNAQVDAAAAIARTKLATYTRRVPVSLHTPASATSAGNSFWSVLAMTDYDLGHWEFVKDVGGKIFGHVLIPEGLAATGGSLVLHIAANATTGVTRLSVSTKAVADAESMQPSSLTTETSQDITVPGTAYLRKDVTFALTEALAEGGLLIVEVYHEGAHANDTLAQNTLLLGATLHVTVQ